ncbi:uncharacterized protein J7T54_001853 [Emericellopsis cladophorae]|uniref:Uncharacterized protein n=1 Tax=Emericellopsis cladophorae TaxID=2686198 RepID=A0A9Q0BFH1_9HYPO|nr:uncharacterized protein J7T54_001853 [Emericellopsis cladophorae]KAI6783977.1 hypothetical protein J7T54_001853 [Emericellopsis cladophorae]
MTSAKHIHVKDLDDWANRLHAQPQRPLLIHLNADTTWLVQIPYPSSAVPPSGRTHYNVLVDPWLQGPQSDVASWFSTQWHVVPPGVATIAELNVILRDLEARRADGDFAGDSLVDLVAISHEFTDHCHRATLEELPPTTPIFATDVAADLIRGWTHFDTVVTTPALGDGVDWTRLTVGSLPPWLAIGRVTTPGNALYYHSAVFIAFDLAGQGTAEAVIYSPHGIESEDLLALSASGISALALLHGLHDVSIWMTKQLNLGALNGLRAVRACGAKYWIATHDEVKTGGGLIAPFLRRVPYSVKEAVAHQEKQMRQQEGKAPEYEFVELGSGDGFLLD